LASGVIGDTTKQLLYPTLFAHSDSKAPLKSNGCIAYHFLPTNLQQHAINTSTHWYDVVGRKKIKIERISQLKNRQVSIVAPFHCWMDGCWMLLLLLTATTVFYLSIQHHPLHVLCHHMTHFVRCVKAIEKIVIGMDGWD
jgi:hypothetical protein